MSNSVGEDVPSCFALYTSNPQICATFTICILITTITIKLALVNIYLFMVMFYKAIKDIADRRSVSRAYRTITNRNALKDITRRQMIPAGPPFHRPLSSTQAFTPNAKKHGLQRSFALIINQPHACVVEEEERND